MSVSPSPPKRGRPRKPGSPTTSVSLAPADRALLDRIADAEDIPIREILIRSVRLYAKAHHYPEEVQAA